MNGSATEQPPTPPQEGTVYERAPMLESEATSVTQWLENVKDVVDEYTHGLRGEAEKDVIVEGKVETKWVQVGTPSMTEEGIQAILRKLRTKVNRVISFGEITEFERYMICVQTDRDLTDTIARNYYAWEIRSEDKDNILHDAMDIIRLGLSKCVKGGQKKFYSSIFTQKDVNAPQQEKVKSRWGF